MLKNMPNMRIGDVFFNKKKPAKITVNLSQCRILLLVDKISPLVFCLRVEFVTRISIEVRAGIDGRVHVSRETKC